MQQHVFDLGLEDERDAHPTRDRVDELMAKRDPGKEVRISDEDLPLRAADRGEISLLDVAAMAEVVADDEPGGLCSHALGATAPGEERKLTGAELHELHERPDALHRL